MCGAASAAQARSCVPPGERRRAGAASQRPARCSSPTSTPLTAPTPVSPHTPQVSNWGQRPLTPQQVGAECIMLPWTDALRVCKPTELAGRNFESL